MMSRHSRSQVWTSYLFRRHLRFPIPSHSRGSASSTRVASGVVLRVKISEPKVDKFESGNGNSDVKFCRNSTGKEESMKSFYR